MNTTPAAILFLPHGGGPLPLLGDPDHHEMVSFLKAIPQRLGTPEAIIVISAHWETNTPIVTSGAQPTLIYDYHGFPQESYTIQYPAPGQPELAAEVVSCLREAGIDANADDQRGFDHGLFVPLTLMYPNADIPCIQISILNSLDPAEHIALGRALAPLREKNILIIGSGLSFHSLKILFSTDPGLNPEIDRFQDWLAETCSSPALSAEERNQRLIHWENAPAARLCHPREEHLLPLHVCYGMAEASPAQVVFDAPVMGRRALGLLW